MNHTTLIFDTWACIKELEQGGFTTKQAEAQTKVLAKFVDERLATKHDIELIKRDIIIKLTSILGSTIVGCFTVLGAMMILLVK